MTGKSSLSEEECHFLQKHAEAIRVKAVRTLEAITLFHTANDYILAKRYHGDGVSALGIIQSRLINSAVLEAYTIYEPHRYSDDATLTRLVESLDDRRTIRWLLESACEWGRGDQWAMTIQVNLMRRKIREFRQEFKLIEELDTASIKFFRDKRLGHNSLLEDVGISYELAWAFCDCVVNAAQSGVFIFSGTHHDWEEYKKLFADSYQSILENRGFKLISDTEVDAD